MDRLTIRTPFMVSNEQAVPIDMSKAGMVAIANRLAAYEDTGLEPEEIAVLQSTILLDGYERGRLFEYQDIGPINHLRELVQAEKEGRLVVLPCRLHKPIYFTDDGELFEDTPYEVSLGQSPGGRNDTLLCICEEGFDFYGDDIGKTVFLTREEAEAALKGANDENRAD